MKKILSILAISLGLCSCANIPTAKQLPEKSYYDDHKLIISDRYSFTVPRDWEINSRSEKMDVVVADKGKNVAINMSYIRMGLPANFLIMLLAMQNQKLGFNIVDVVPGKLNNQDMIYIGSVSEDGWLKQVLVSTKEYQYVFTCFISRSDNRKQYAEMCADSIKHLTVK